MGVRSDNGGAAGDDAPAVTADGGRLSSRSGMNATITTVAELGISVRTARKALGLTQDVLAAAAGVGPRFVVELEAGKPTLQMDKVLAVLVTLGLALRLDPASS